MSQVKTYKQIKERSRHVIKNFPNLEDQKIMQKLQDEFDKHNLFPINYEKTTSRDYIDFLEED